MAKKYMDQSMFDGIAAALASMDYNKSEEYKNHKMKDFRFFFEKNEKLKISKNRI